MDKHVIQATRNQFNKQLHKIYAHFKQHDDPYLFFTQYTKMVTYFIKKIWHNLCNLEQEKYCLIAIGGFGRGELYPYSDIDLAFITTTPLTEYFETLITQYVGILWDIGLFPSMTAGSIKELFNDAKNEITLETSLLEGKFILGNSAHFHSLSLKLDNHRDTVNFIGAKFQELQNRHNKLKGAVKLLEPDIKNSPGGLRDIHTLLWISKAQGLKADIYALTKNNIITKNEANLIINSHRNLARIRIHLHMLTGKNENHLFFNYQNELTKLMHCDHSNDLQQNTEQLMQIVYRSTKIVRQLLGILIPMLKQRVYAPYPRIVYQINKNYYQVGNLIACNHLDIFKRNPTQILEIIIQIQRNKNIIGMAPKTLRAWWLAVQNLDSTYAENPRNQKRFIDLFKYGRNLFEILQFLNLYGFLEKYIPDFSEIVGLLQNDLFHIYPVDDHTLTVIYYLTRLENDDYNFEAPFASNLMKTFKNKYVLYLAALFHDIGKGRRKEHEIIGAQIARQFCEKHHLKPKDTELITWLVKNHLQMSATAQKKNIGDYHIIKKFSEFIDNTERLISLYLLTISDIRGTNPTIWNTWKSNLLLQLFSATFKILKDSNSSDLADIERKKTTIKRLVAEYPQLKKQIINFSINMDDAFFNSQTFDDIKWQMNEIIQSQSKPFFTLRLLDENTLACIIFMPIQNDNMLTLYKIFAHLHLNIIQAKTFNTLEGFALNKYIVSFPINCNEDDVQRITQELNINVFFFLTQSKDLSTLSIPEVYLTRRSLHSNIIPKVTILQENYQHNSQEYFVISIITINKNALLANIVELFNQYNVKIISANINTLGERVEDSFLLKASYLISSKNRIQFKNKLLNICSL